MISIVVPLYDEQECLPELYRRLSRLALELELIFVDDGSRDATAAILRALAAADRRVRVVTLPRNRGSQEARFCVNCALWTAPSRKPANGFPVFGRNG